MWIMIIRELPTMGVEVAPGEVRHIEPVPFMSIHWAVPWIVERYVARQQRQAVIEAGGVPSGRGKSKTWALPDTSEVDESDLLSATDPYAPGVFGMFEPNWKGALKITWQGDAIRVFPHEYSALKAENMHYYVFGDSHSEPSHELQHGSIAEQQLIDGMLDNDLRPAYEALLIDGCTHDQATAIMLGQDVFDDDAEIAPSGWYRIKADVLQALEVAA